MMTHPDIRLLWITPGGAGAHPAMSRRLQAIRHIHIDRQPRLPADLDPYQAVITLLPSYSTDDLQRLTAFAGRRGRGWLLWTAGASAELPAVCGAKPDPLDASAELRVLFSRPEEPLAARLPDAIYVSDIRHTLQPLDARTETVLYADWRYTHRAVLTRRPLDDGWVAATTLGDGGHPVVQQVVHRLIRQFAGHPAERRPIGAALLGYAPSVGQLHGQGVAQTDGLALAATCDLDPDRRKQAGIDFPGVPVYARSEDLLSDPAVELVIVATPPNTHAELSRRLLATGKHVVCEKPLALTAAESEAMAESADRYGRLLCCHQNRRFDADFLAIEAAVHDGLIGELFYLETFVGGFSHPCGYWHSHAPICGGTTYDWGAHYLDWIVGLIPHRIETVQCTRHKRVWHDVTNADQERILIRFAHGAEAEFLHSDIAAARKPKWYLLGTRGAITADWREIQTHQPDPVHYYEAHTIPLTEMTPRLTARRRDGEGRIYARELPAPQPPRFAFHRNLADHLHWGEPLRAPLADSMRVVAILEAAARSAETGGTRQVPVREIFNG